MPLEDIWDEIRAVESWHRNNDRAQSAAARIGPQQAEQMALAARMWPGIRPGALIALGRGGYRADHPMAQQLAELSAVMDLRDHPAGVQFGDRAVTPAMRNASAESRREANRARALNESSEMDSDVRTEFQRDNVRARENAANPRIPAPPEDSPVREAWEQANVGGLIDKYGFFEQPGRYTSGDPQDYLYTQVQNAYFEAGQAMPVMMANGKPAELRAKGRTTSGNAWDFDIEYLIDEPEQEDAGGRSLLGPGASLERTETAGIDSGVQALRYIGMGANAPVQEIQGLVRTLYGATQGKGFDPQLQSDLAVQLQNPNMDAGSGFFVDEESQVARERRRREAEYGQIGGHNVTLGRWTAAGLSPFDPDTKPYQVLSGFVDFGVQLADPSSWGLSQGGKAIRAQRLFAAGGDDAVAAAGGVRGLRSMVRPANAAHTLDTHPDVLSGLAAERSPYNIWRATGRQWPMDLARRVADEANTPEDVRRILEPELGGRVREVRSVTGVTPNRLASVTPASVTPGAMGETLESGLVRGSPVRVMPARGRIDAHDQDIVAFEVEATLRNAGASDEVLAGAVDRVARADSPIKLNAAIRRAVDDDLGGILKLSGVEDEAVRSRLTRLHADAHEETSRTFAEAQTFQGVTDNPLMVGGEQQWYPGAHLINEHAPRWMTMPEPRAIRRLTTEMPHIFGKQLPGTAAKRTLFTKADGDARLPTTMLDFFQNELWKPMQLMRLAWTARVVGEEQVRMAAAGYDSMFKHPLSYISTRVSKDSRTGRALKAIPRVEPGRAGTDVAGNLLDEADEFTAAMSQRHGGWVERAQVPTGTKTTFYKGRVHERDRFDEAWGSELIRLSSDPVARQVANSGSLDEAVEWFTRGAGNRHRGDLAAAHPGRFDTPDQARSYIETVQRRIDNATNGNTDLFDAVRTGRFQGDEMLTGTSMAAGLPGRLDSFYDDYAPDMIVGDEMKTLSPGSNVLAKWDSAVDRLFGFLMTDRTNNLSRSPTFKQEYWREAERILPMADEATRAAIVSEAKNANLGTRAIRRMERVKSTGEANLTEIDTWAKAHALDATKDLLYDMTRKGRFMDAARIVFPFGEAWAEVFTRWFGPRGLVASNPKTVRRFQQLMQGARGEEFGEVMGAPEGEGFFWKNEFGEEVFTIPGSRILTDATLGVPIPMTGSVQGLSMFGSVVPGIGPALQIPVGWIMQNKPGPEWMKEALHKFESAKNPITGETVRDTINPFGSIGSSDQGEITDVRNYLPTWMRTAFDVITEGDGNEGQYGNAVMSIAAYLRSTGRYSNDRAGQQQLLEDASHEARWFTLIRAAGQGISPSSPSPDWLVVDRNDKTVRLRALAEEYRSMQEEDFENADAEFLDKYGPNLLAALTPQTAGVEYSIPTTREGAQWVLEHPGIEGELPHTYGFFAPQGGEFDYALYERQLLEGDRQQLDPETFIRLMSNTTADSEYRAAVDEVEAAGESTSSTIARGYLASVRERLYEEFPTWGDSSRIGQRPETEVMIRELEDALSNDAAMSTDAGQALREYMAGRAEVRAWQESEGMSLASGLLSSAEGTEVGHAYLWDLSDRLIEEHPGFKSLFDVVLSRELEVVEAGDTGA